MGVTAPGGQADVGLVVVGGAHNNDFEDFTAICISPTQEVWLGRREGRARREEKRDGEVVKPGPGSVV
jgi:hypothetical protein